MIIRRKLLYLFLLSLVFLVFPLEVFASFQKYEFNPVLKPGKVGWDEKGVGTPSVIYDNGIYKMWYMGFNNSTSQIGYAVSPDGINWSSHSEPVLSPISLEKGLADMSVIKDGEKYKMWFTVSHSNDTYHIHYATSDDGISWERYSSPVLNPDLWETKGLVAAPSVIKIGDEYHMWYLGNDSKWKIGYASSANGINWSKHSLPVLIATESWEGSDAGNPSVIYNLGKFEMFYHANFPIHVIGYANSINKISWNKTVDISINPIITRGPQLFDSLDVTAPSLLVLNNIYQMWYSGQDSSGIWSIGYATTGEFLSNLNPVVVLPGMFASWNSKAILENEEVNQSDWIMTPFVNDYDGIINTLKSVGYSDDPQDTKQNLFVFNYDWRKPVEETALLLETFLQEKVLPKSPNKQVDLIGHSLGGLVGRTYLRNDKNHHVNQLITLGTPHYGAIQAYKGWEGGVVDNNSVWEKLALEIILGINRNGFRTNKDIIRETVPVVHDLLPVFDYLKDTSDLTIPLANLKHQNLWLTNLSQNFADYLDKFYAIYGQTGETPEWYKVTKPNLIENLLGLWQDGKPTETYNSLFGDETVLAKSATNSADPASLFEGINHRKLVSEETVITEVMNQLDLQPEKIITPAPQPPILPALFFALKSPVTLKVNGPSGTFASDNNILLITNATGGDYQIQVTGLDTGKYQLIIGELGLNNTAWKEISNNTNLNKIDLYRIVFDPNDPSTNLIIDPNGSVLLANAYSMLETLKEKYPQWNLTLAQLALKNAQTQLEKTKYDNSAEYILNTIRHLFSFRKKQALAYPDNTAFTIIEDLAISYEKILGQKKIKINVKKQETEIKLVETLKTVVYQKLKFTGNEQKAQSYLLGEKMLNSAKTNFEKGNFAKAEIDIILAKLLFLEV